MSANISNTANGWTYRSSYIKTSAVDTLASSSYIANTANTSSNGLSSSSWTSYYFLFFLLEKSSREKNTEKEVKIFSIYNNDSINFHIGFVFQVLKDHHWKNIFSFQDKEKVFKDFIKGSFLNNEDIVVDKHN